MMPSLLDDPLLDELEAFSPGDEYEHHSRYIDLHRRVRLGPAVVVVFENGRTLRFRVQELARLARCAGAERVSRELAWYKSLLPGPDRLIASVTLKDRMASRTAFEAAVALKAGDHLIPGEFLSHTAGDRIIGLTRWVRFRFAPADLAAVSDPSRPLSLSFDSADYRYEGLALPTPVRTSLLGDLGR